VSLNLNLYLLNRCKAVVGLVWKRKFEGISPYSGGNWELEMAIHAFSVSTLFEKPASDANDMILLH
jgi:hypothetical protein